MQGAENRKVRLVVHSDYADYDSLATDYDKKIIFCYDYASMITHGPRFTTLVIVEGDVQVDLGRRTGYLS